ncbi:MAG: type II secretion system protein [Steroidobacteraceae bacterium]
MRPASQSGFTLIELVVVIIILGVLAAFAVPRFMGLDQQARIASVNSMVGTLRSAASMAHGVWLAQGAPAAPITIDGQTITFTNGYPNAASIGSLLAAGTVTANGLAGTFTSNGAGNFQLNGAPKPATCEATYRAAAANSEPTIATVQANLGSGNPQIVGGC